MPEGSGGERLPLGQSRVVGRVIPVPVGIDVPEGHAASLGIPGDAAHLPPRHPGAAVLAPCRAGSGAAWLERVFLVLRVVLAAVSHRHYWGSREWGSSAITSRGLAGSQLLVPSLLPFTGGFVVSLQPRGCRLSTGGRSAGIEGLSVQVHQPASSGARWTLQLTGAWLKVEGVECVR